MGGKRTERNLSPDEVFRELKSKDGSPRYMMLVGVPGSGKSTWSRAAEKQGWVVVNPDSIRQNLIKELRDSGGKIWIERKQPDGSKKAFPEIPDPSNPEHVFSPKYLRAGIEIARKTIEEAFAQGKNVVDDKLNTHLFYRAKDIETARAHGYYVEGLVFQSAGPEVNLANTALRKANGGLPISEKYMIDAMKTHAFFNHELRVDADFRTAVGQPLPNVSRDVAVGLISGFDTLGDAYRNSDAKVRKAIDAHYAQDVFNDVQIVLTPDWSKNGSR